MVNRAARPKTPLRYPGGKSRALKKMRHRIDSLIDGSSNYIEPFIGGGSVAIDITRRHPTVRVTVNDKNPAVANFWRCLRDNADEMISELLRLKNEHNTQESARTLFDSIKNASGSGLSLVSRAINFYCLNKLSFSGLTEGSSYSKLASDQNFTVSSISNLALISGDISEWDIRNEDYSDVIFHARPSDFVYMDPPYSIKDNLYGKNGKFHSGFNHFEFADEATSCRAKCLISYNSTPEVLGMFDESLWDHDNFDLTYTMRSTGNYMENQKKRMELLLWK